MYFYESLKLAYFCALIIGTPVIYLIPLLAVLAGIVLGYALPSIRSHYIGLLLSFSGAFLLAITFFELLPEIYEELDSHQASLFILGGLLLQILLEFFSKGIEHGHRINTAGNPDILLSLGWSLCLHALLEGFPLVSGTHIVWGVAIHKLPVALILSYTLLKSELVFPLKAAMLLVFVISTPLGTYLAANQSGFQEFQWQFTALSAGIFLHVSTVILFESSKDHKLDFGKIGIILLGIAVAYFL